MEAAAQALSLHRLATITFDAAAFTNFSLEHSEFYATQDEYFAAKLQLFKQLSPHARVVLNADDAHVGACIQALSQASFDTSDIVFVSVAAQSKFSQNDNDSKARMINRFVIDPKQSVSGVVLQSDLSALKLEITSRERSYTCSSKALLGSFSAYNVLTAIALVEPYGVSETVIQAAIASFAGVPGRLKRFDVPNKAVAFIDNAHTPSSFEAILSALRPLSSDLIVVFGAGGDRDAVKRPLMGAIAAQYANQVIITTDNPRSENPKDIIDQIKAGIKGNTSANVDTELDREAAIRKAYKLSRSGSIIALLGKGPVEYQHVGNEKIPFSEAAILQSLS